VAVTSPAQAGVAIDDNDAMGTRRWRALAAGVALSALVGCGGAGGDSAEPTDDVVRLQPGNRPLRFRLDTAVSDETLRFTVETLTWAHTDLGDSGPLTVHVYSDEEHFVTAYTADFAISIADAREELANGQTAFASPGGHIWIYLGNYEQAPEDVRREALFHEYNHTLQEWQAEVRFQSQDRAERSFVPRWMVEGCAQYLAIKAGARRGFVDEELERDVVLDRAADTGEPLGALETAGQAGFIGGSEAAYTVGGLGCERLATTRGEDAVAHRFWLAMATHRDWKKAFADAYGTTPAEFYRDFEAYRTTL
jgi:hypothetical protein